MNKLNTKFLGLSIMFYCIVNHDDYDIGMLELSVDGRTYRLDALKVDVNDEDNFTEITCNLITDLDVAPIDEENKYDLTDIDLFDVKLSAKLYIGVEYEIEPEHITLFVENDGLTRTINVEIDN